FATYLATTDLGAELTRLETLNAAVAADLGSDLKDAKTFSVQNIDRLKARRLVEGRFGNIEVAAWLGDNRILLRDAGLPAQQSAPPRWIEESAFTSTVVQDRQLFLFAYRRVRVKDGHAIVMSREKVDPELLDRIGQNFQEISFLRGASGVVVLEGDQRRFGVSDSPPEANGGDSNPNVKGEWKISGGQLSGQGDWFD